MDRPAFNSRTEAALASQSRSYRKKSSKSEFLMKPNPAFSVRFPHLEGLAGEEPHR